MPSFHNYSRRAAQSLLLLATFAGLFATTTQAATNVAVDNSVDNSFNFLLFPLAQISDASSISGTVNIETTEAAGEVTSITFLGGDIQIPSLSISQPVDFLGAFPGTLSITFTNVHIDVIGGPYAVAGTVFDPAGLTWNFNQGDLVISLDSLITGLITIPIDLDTAPQTFTTLPGTRSGTIDPLLNLYLPMDVASVPFDVNGSQVFFSFNATLSSQVVPEASSMTLLGIGLGIATLAAKLRRRSS